MTTTAEEFFRERLPTVPDRRLAIRVTPDALRQIRGGHPWVYADKITSVSGAEQPAEPVPGTLGVVFDRDRKFAAIGLYDPESPIRLRILHAGRPTPIDEQFWTNLVAGASDLRSGIGSDTTGYRLLNGENDGTGGLIVDRYEDTLVIKIYSTAWLPHLADVASALERIIEPSRVVVRLGRLAGREIESLADGVVASGPPLDGPVLFLENGLTFEADVISGQKTGHFLDQRDNRQRIRDRAAEKSLLDVFCCTGGFSVYAAAGGATDVLAVDQSPSAIETAERNMARNPSRNPSKTGFRTLLGDAFEVLDDLGQQRRTFDIVVVDPPSFASKASDKDGAMRAYRKLAELAVPLVRPGGLLMQASCSSRVSVDDLVSTVGAAISNHGRSIESSEVTGHALDHPVSFRQGRYLKAMFADLD